MRSRISALITIAALAGPAAFAVESATAAENTQAAVSAVAAAGNPLTMYGNATQPVTLTLTGVKGGGSPAGSVVFTVYSSGGTLLTTGSAPLTSAGVNKSSATYNFSNARNVGSYEIRTAYSPATGSPYAATPTGSFATSGTFVSVMQRTTSTALSKPAGDTVRGTVTSVAGADGTNASNPTAGTVTFTITGDATATKTANLTAANNYGEYTFPFAGDYTVAASYGQNGNYGGSSAPGTSVSVGKDAETTGVALDQAQDKVSGTFVEKGTGTLVAGARALTVSVAQGSTQVGTCSNVVTVSATSKFTCILNADVKNNRSYTVTVGYAVVDAAYKKSTTVANVNT